MRQATRGRNGNSCLRWMGALLAPAVRRRTGVRKTSLPDVSSNICDAILPAIPIVGIHAAPFRIQVFVATEGVAAAFAATEAG